jgi:hypothetical protein
MRVVKASCVDESLQQGSPPRTPKQRSPDRGNPRLLRVTGPRKAITRSAAQLDHPGSERTHTASKTPTLVVRRRCRSHGTREHCSRVHFFIAAMLAFATASCFVARAPSIRAASSRVCVPCIYTCHRAQIHYSRTSNLFLRRWLQDLSIF